MIADASISKKFKCDHLVPEDASQDETFEACGLASLVDKVLQGYNSTVFAYGQTGSGKSFTMHGGDEGEAEGLTGKLIKSLYKKISEQKNNIKFSVTVSFLQIYSEKIYDLLNPGSLNNRSLSFTQNIEGLRLRWHKDDQFTVGNLFVYECRD